MQTLLKTAANLLQDGQQQQLLTLYAFKREGIRSKRNPDKLQPKLNNTAIAQLLHCSERTLYRDRDIAIKALAKIIVQQILPPLRSEQPQSQNIIGREVLAQQCLTWLEQHQSISLSGMGGVGKSTLAMFIAKTWHAERTFWFTVRPGFNDQLATLLFALAYFLRKHGVLNTWRQLVAERGKISIEPTLGLLRHDFAMLAARANTDMPEILICIDEVDLLQIELSEHAQLLHLIEELIKLTPTICIGQRPVLVTQHHLILGGFLRPEFEAWLAQSALAQLAVDKRDRLFHVTNGTAGLLMLYHAMQLSGIEVENMLQPSAQPPSAEVLYTRIRQRLNVNQQHLLKQLAIFRGAVPKQAFTDDAGDLLHLITLGLVQPRPSDMVQVSPYIQRLVVRSITADENSVLNLFAAQLFEKLADIIQAMFHYVEGEQSALAVKLWAKNVEIERERGKSAAALEILNRISADHLPNSLDRDVLYGFRGSLNAFLGNDDAAILDLKQAQRTSHPRLKARALTYLGNVQQNQGQIEAAIATYHNALDTFLWEPGYHQTFLYAQLAFTYTWHANDIANARKSALEASIEAAIFSSDVETHAGNFSIAAQYLHNAQQLIPAGEGYLLQKSRLYERLAQNAWKLGNGTQAIVYAQQAIDINQVRGDQLAELASRSTLSAAYIVAGQYPQAIIETQHALVLAERLKIPRSVAVLAANEAEAHYFLRDYAEAERCAMRSLAQEEERFRPFALMILGKVYQAQGKWAASEATLKHSIQNAIEINHVYAEANSQRALGDLYFESGQNQDAKTVYLQALTLYQQMGLDKDVATVTCVIADLTNKQK